MAGKDKSKQVVLFGIRETGVYGDDAAPTAAMLASNISHTALAGTTATRDNFKGYLGNTGTLRATNYQELTFDVELAGSGAAGTAPAYGGLLRACGVAEVISVGVDVQYSPIDSGHEDGTIYYYYDDILHKMTGVRGSVDFVQDLGGLWKMQFKFIGLYNDAEEATPSTTNTSLFKTPIVANSQTVSTFSFFGQTMLQMTKLTVTPGIEVNHFDATNQEEVEISDRNGTMSTTIREPDLSTINFFKKTKQGDEGSLTVQLGSTTGQIVLFDIPNIQLSGTTRGEEQNKSNLTITGDIVPTTAGSDWKLTIK